MQSVPDPHEPSLSQSPEDALGERIFTIHTQLSGFCPAIRRIAVAVYDPPTDILRTFLHSASGRDGLHAYERPLADVPSLKVIADSRQPRIIDDLTGLASSPSDHTVSLLAAGYRSSFTVPLASGSQFLGFLFFDADQKNVFSSGLVAQLMVYSQLIALLIAHERSTVTTLLGAVRTAMHFSRFRDEETAAHLARMSHYARQIAIGLPDSQRPTDEEIEFLLHFAPLHDLGKIGVPDGILRKKGRLTAQELPLMRAHVDHGVALVDAMLEEFGLGDLHHVQMLRNIIQYHHENFDGTGYNKGLAGAAIPLEARIVKVADVLDALTSERPYKEAWSFEQAYAYLGIHSGRMFDPDCVASLLAQQDVILDIRRRFHDEPAPAAA